jgi:hypothetical protein
LAYYKIRLEVWCDWNPEESDLEEIAQNISTGEAICTKRVVIAVVDRPQDIEDDVAMSFFWRTRRRRGSKPGVDIVSVARIIRGQTERASERLRRLSDFRVLTPYFAAWCLAYSSDLNLPAFR